MFLNPEHVLNQVRFKDSVSIGDLGSGAGAFSISLAKRLRPYGEVIAVDVNPNILSYLAGRSRDEGLSNLHVVAGDIELLGGSGIRDCVLDAVLLTNTLFQLDKPDKALHEVGRILKPKGTVLVIDWKDSFGGIGPEKKSVIPAERVQKLFLEKGFRLYNEIDAGEYHYGFLFKKN